MSSIPHDHVAGHGEGHDDHAHHPTGIMRWITTTNHKDIGTMYLWFSFTMFIVGGCMALTIRAELFQPGLQVVNPEFFNSMTTLHGLIMVFGALMPGAVGFANWMIPLQIGAPDMAFARMNNWSFWLLPPAAILLVGSLFVPGGAAAAGWTLYPPLTIQAGMGMDFTIFAVHIMGASSIMGSINIITTILNLRAPGMTLMKMPLFCWTWLITAYLLIAVMPVLAGAVTMLLTDRHFGTTFFNAAGGGDPVLFQHVFWFFGHPEVYIIILPAFGIISEILPDVLAQAAVRLRVDGLRGGRHRDPVVHRLGAPHVHDRPAHGRHPVLHVRDDADRGADGREGVQLARDDVEGLAHVRGADAVRDRLPVPVHDGRLHRPRVRDPADRRADPGHLLRRRPLPLRDGRRHAVRVLRRRVLLAAQVVRPHVRREAGRMAFLAVVRVLQHHVLPDALPRPRRHAAADSRLRAAVRRLEHGRVDRRLRLRLHAAAVLLRGGEVHPQRRPRRRPSRGKAARRWNGRCRRPRRITRSRRRPSSGDADGADAKPAPEDMRCKPTHRRSPTTPGG